MKTKTKMKKILVIILVVLILLAGLAYRPVDGENGMTANRRRTLIRGSKPAACVMQNRSLRAPGYGKAEDGFSVLRFFTIYSTHLSQSEPLLLRLLRFCSLRSF